MRQPLEKPKELKYPHQFFLNLAISYFEEGNALAAAESLYAAALHGSFPATETLLKLTYEFKCKPDEEHEVEAFEDTPDNHFRLGLCHLCGIAPYAQSDELAVKHIKKAAETSVNAQHMLGILYTVGRAEPGMQQPQRNKEAVQWLIPAAEKKHPGALCALAVMHKANKVTPGHDENENHKLAIKNLKEAANQHLPDALFELSNIYTDRGKNTEAADFLKEAAELGHASAQTMLGKMYADLIKTKSSMSAENKKQAAHWYEEAANQGHPAAQHNLGVMYFRENTGHEMTERQRYEKAFSLFSESAKHNDNEAQFALGYMYDKERFSSTEMRDDEKDKQACFWYLKAANNRHARAKEHLTTMHTENRTRSFIKEQLAALTEKTEEELISDLQQSYQPFRQITFATAKRFITLLQENGKLNEGELAMHILTVDGKTTVDKALTAFAKQKAAAAKSSLTGRQDDVAGRGKQQAAAGSSFFAKSSKQKTQEGASAEGAAAEGAAAEEKPKIQGTAKRSQDLGGTGDTLEDGSSLNRMDPLFEANL